MKEKIVLGTVQLGLSYGINNTHGKPSETEAFNILEAASANGINILDTADAYGNSLEVIGKFIKLTGRQFQIVNKFKLDSVALTEKLNNCLQVLNQQSLFCYMYHNFADYEEGTVSDELFRLKESALIRNIGVSLYSTDQLRQVANDPLVDIIQLPINVFDLDEEKKALLKQCKKKGKEIHARSVFLQGLFFKDPSSLTGNLAQMRPYLEKFAALTKKHQLSPRTALLNFVLQKDYVDFVVLGIEHVSQLAENLDSVDPTLDTRALEEIKIEPQDQYLINPVNWKV